MVIVVYQKPQNVYGTVDMSGCGKTAAGDTVRSFAAVLGNICSRQIPVGSRQY